MKGESINTQISFLKRRRGESITIIRDITNWEEIEKKD